MPDDKDIDNDSALFRKAVAGSRRLKTDKIRPYRRRVKAIPLKRIEDEQQVLEASLEPVSHEYLLESGETLFYAQSGVQQNVLKKLKRGQLSIEAELDLHRMTTDQAYDALMDFIITCQQRHIRCVRIIHGKGLGSRDKLPVLKNRVNSWLRQWKNVLAFCTARPCDGGTGAIYVLLKRV